MQLDARDLQALGNYSQQKSVGLHPQDMLALENADNDKKNKYNNPFWQGVQALSNADAETSYRTLKHFVPKSEEERLRKLMHNEQNTFANMNPSPEAKGLEDYASIGGQLALATASGGALGLDSAGEYLGSKLIKAFPNSKLAKLAAFSIKKGVSGIPFGLTGGDENSSTGKDIGLGMGLNIAGSAIEPAVRNLLSKGVLKALGSKASPEEIEKNLKETKGMPITGADIIDSAMLGSVQGNMLSRVFGAGQMTKFNKIFNHVKDRAGNLYKGLIGDKSPSHLMDEVEKNIKNSYSKAQADAEGKYTGLYQYLKKIGAKLDRSKTTEVARKELSKYLQGIEQEGSLLESPELGKTLASLASAKGSSVKFAKYGKAKLYRLMQEALDPHEKKVYKKLYNARTTDLENTVKNTGDKTAENLYRKADENFKKTLAPFRDARLSKMVNGAMHPTDIFRQFVKTGKAENPTKLETFAKVLTPEDKKLVGAHLFNGAREADGSINPVRFNSVWKSLGNRTKEALFTPSEIKDFDNFSNQMHLARTSLGALVNPLTGVQAERGHVLRHSLQTLATLFAWKHPHAALGAAGGIGLVHGLQIAINSPKVWAKVVKLANGDKIKALQMLSKATPALMNANSGAQQQ